jgi:hypothetical protein
MRCWRSIKRPLMMLLFVAVVAAVGAACGASSPRAELVPAPQQLPAPGTDSPQAAVAGYLTGYVKNDGNMVCQYVAPSQRGLCGFLTTQSSFSLSGWNLGNSMVRGKEAIVVVLAQNFCAGPGGRKACQNNTDPNKGLPAQTDGFEQAFDTTSNAVPNLSVVQVNGKWYVALA